MCVNDDELIPVRCQDTEMQFKQKESRTDRQDERKTGLRKYCYVSVLRQEPEW